MKTKRILSVLMAAVLTLTAPTLNVSASTQTPFSDVDPNSYYADAVSWSVENEITIGVGDNKFAPDDFCTRAQIVTFLWRAANQPEADSITNPFSDVKPSAYYYNAVLWAVENGITTGTSTSTFSPNNRCTRAQAVTFLWRANGSESISNSTSPFADVDNTSYYAEAVSWAVANGITTGTSTTTFSPDTFCSRAQIVTFLYRTEYPYSDSDNPLTEPDGKIIIDCGDLTIDKTTTINITAYAEQISVDYDSNIVEVEWGEWNGNNITLTIQPVGNGTSTLSIYDANNPQECVTLNVTVSNYEEIYNEEQYYNLAYDAYDYVKANIIYPHTINLIAAEAGHLSDGSAAVKFSYMYLNAYEKNVWDIKYYIRMSNGNIACFDHMNGFYDFSSSYYLDTDEFVH